MCAQDQDIGLGWVTMHVLCSNQNPQHHLQNMSLLLVGGTRDRRRPSLLADMSRLNRRLVPNRLTSRTAAVCLATPGQSLHQRTRVGGMHNCTGGAAGNHDQPEPFVCVAANVGRRRSRHHLIRRHHDQKVTAANGNARRRIHGATPSLTAHASTRWRAAHGIMIEPSLQPTAYSPWVASITISFSPPQEIPSNDVHQRPRCQVHHHAARAPSRRHDATWALVVAV